MPQGRWSRQGPTPCIIDGGSPPNVCLPLWKTRFNVIRKPIWRQTEQPVPFYAKAAKAMSEAKGYPCDFLMLDPTGLRTIRLENFQWGEQDKSGSLLGTDKIVR